MVEAPKPRNSIEAVASAPSGVRTAAIDLALLRAPVAPTDMAAVRRYFQEVMGSGEKKEAPRTLSVGGLRGDQLNQIWAAGDTLIKRAETMLRLRGARAWAHELAKKYDTSIRANSHIADIVFHVLENGEGASHHLQSQFMRADARRIKRAHRGRIERGVRIYEKYLSYAKKAHGDPHDLEEILHEWQHPPFLAAPSPPDIRPANYRDNDGRLRASRIMKGHIRLEEMTNSAPETDTRFNSLSPEEKIVYVEYLGMLPEEKFVARSRLVPFFNDYNRISPILAKMQGTAPYPERPSRGRLSQAVKRALASRREASPAQPIPPRTLDTVVSRQAVPSLSEASRGLPSPESSPSVDDEIDPEELARARRRLGLDS